MQTERSESIRSVAADTRGKHRISAELKRLEQETRHLELCWFLAGLIYVALLVSCWFNLCGYASKFETFCFIICFLESLDDIWCSMAAT
ncbi:hypothetical protein Hdeb2414_s1108g00982781 [Helianthus debilis subsp. tardiflorus]